MELARFCLMMSHLERCYAEQNQHKDQEQTLAMEIYRAMERNKQKLTKGILKTVTMIYQDMFRVRVRLEESRVIHCMHRVGGFRFNRSITVANMRQQ